MSTDNKFTSGAWKVRGGVNEFFIDAPPIVCLAVINSLCATPKAVDEAKANAALISASPELLAALESCMELLTDFKVRFKICDGGRGNLGEQAKYMRATDDARQAIAKATGQTHLVRAAKTLSPAR